MASSLGSFDFAGSSAKPSSSVTYLCRSVKRTVNGSKSGYFSCSWMPISSASLQVISRAIVSLSLLFREAQRLALGDIVAIPLGDLHYVIAGPGNHRLAAQAGVQLQIRCHIQSIQLIVICRRELIAAILNPQVTGGASAGTATGMVEKNIEMLRHVEKRHGLSMMTVRQGAVLKFDRLALREKCYANRVAVIVIHCLLSFHEFGLCDRVRRSRTLAQLIVRRLHRPALDRAGNRVIHHQFG